jgi:hypothetical protein
MPRQECLWRFLYDTVTYWKGSAFAGGQGPSPRPSPWPCLPFPAHPQPRRLTWLAFAPDWPNRNNGGGEVT